MIHETSSFYLQENHAAIQCHSLDDLKQASISRISLAIGVFDGVHLGHQKLLDVLVKQAERTDSVPVAMTFFPHPRQILTPDSPPALLLPPREKIRLLQEHGVKAVVTLPFTRNFSQMPPEQFLAYCLTCKGIVLKNLCVGSHWRFGAGGQGDTAYLGRVAAEKKFDFHPVPELELNGETVSSSAIRKAVLTADLQKAALFLGHPYTLYGVVEHGKQLAGKELEHPTANLRTEYGVLPPCGVYACRAYIDGECLP